MFGRDSREIVSSISNGLIRRGLPTKTPSIEKRFYDGQHVLLNEIPNIWNFFNGLCNKQILSSTFDEKPTNEAKHLSEIKQIEIKQLQIKPVSNIPQNPLESVPTEIHSTQIE